MKFEIDLIKADLEQIPLSDKGQPIFGEVNSVRAGLRKITDMMIYEALLANNLPILAETMAGSMLLVAEIAHCFRSEPEVTDLIQGVQALIESSRAVLDKGLMLHSPETTACGVVMMEIVCRGLCVSIGLPYERTLEAVHKGEDLTTFIKPPSEAANDPANPKTA
jgi:hypothetical protein